MATIYETKDGQQFKYEGDAQTHANNLAEEQAKMEQWKDELHKSYEKSTKLGSSILGDFHTLLDKHRMDSYNCRERGDFEGAIREMKCFIQNINSPTFIQSVKDTIECFTESKDTYQDLKNQWEAILADKPIYQAEIAMNYQELCQQKVKTKDYRGALNDIFTAVATFPFNNQLRDGLVEMLAKAYYLLAQKLGNESNESFAEDIIFNINAANLLGNDDDARERLQTAYWYVALQLRKQEKYTDYFLVLQRIIRLHKELNEPEDKTKNLINALTEARPSLLELSKNEKEFNRLLITAGLPPQRADELIQMVTDIRVKNAAALPRTDVYNDMKGKYETLYVEKITKSAESGDVESQMTMGYLYANGKHLLPQDYAKAREWYRKAEKQGSAEAKAELEKLKGK